MFENKKLTCDACAGAIGPKDRFFTWPSRTLWNPEPHPAAGKHICAKCAAELLRRVSAATAGVSDA